MVIDTYMTTHQHIQGGRRTNTQPDGQTDAWSLAHTHTAAQHTDTVAIIFM